MARSDVHKTAVITPFSLYEFLTLFVLKNAAQAFQCLMDSVCQGLSYVFVYLDDILVGSRTDKEHWSHLAALFDRLKAHGLVLNLAKCVFAQPGLKFLGHRVGVNGISPAEDNVKAIKDFPRPATMRQLMEFNGMVNFYHCFVLRAAKLISPLYDATVGIGSGQSVLTKTVEWMP